MRKLLFFISCALYAQEVITVIHTTGAASIQNNLHGGQVDTGLGAVSSTFPLPRTDQTAVDTSLSGVAIPITADITGSGSAQSVAVTTTVGMPAVIGTSYIYVLFDAGTSTQEVAQVQAITSSTHFLAIVHGNHTVASGSNVRVIYSQYSKWLEPIAASVGVSGLSNIGFIRQAPLPPNVYDQYILPSYSGNCTGYVADDDALPWYSSQLPTVPQYDPGSLTSTGAPSNMISLLAGPTASGTVYIPCVRVQVLFTIFPEPTMRNTTYQYWWEH